MTSEADQLRGRLQRAGFTSGAVDAVWPEWWSAEAERSISAVTELRFTLARRLGLSPQSMFEDQPRFVWRDETKFKNLGDVTDQERSILSSFGVAVGSAALSLTERHEESLVGMPASRLRSALLANSSAVGLRELLTVCWSIGVPVLKLELFPLAAKRMSAMTASVGGRFAVLIGRDSSYLAPVAYLLAHELGHIALGHLTGASALVEIQDPWEIEVPDDEELAADRYALELLTGSPQPTYEPEIKRFNSGELAAAAQIYAGPLATDPGVIAMCVGHSTGRWPQVFGALKQIPPGQVDVGGQMNDLAGRQLSLHSRDSELVDYLNAVMSGARR